MTWDADILETRRGVILISHPETIFIELYGPAAFIASHSPVFTAQVLPPCTSPTAHFGAALTKTDHQNRSSIELASLAKEGSAGKLREKKKRERELRHVRASAHLGPYSSACGSIYISIAKRSRKQQNVCVIRVPLRQSRTPKRSRDASRGARYKTWQMRVLRWLRNTNVDIFLLNFFFGGGGITWVT